MYLKNIQKSRGKNNMTTINFYIGKFDKLTHKQELSNEYMLNAIHRILTKHNVLGYTVTSCKGCYTYTNGTIVREPSYKVTVCDKHLSFRTICNELKLQLNQESILIEILESNIQAI